MKKRIQFPLFELVLILIFLFILAVFAIPKFVEVGIETRIRALHSTALNLAAVNRLLYSRALIKGVHENALQDTDVLGSKDAGAFLVYGELRAEKSDLQRFLESDLIQYYKGDSLGGIRLYLDRHKSSGCYVYYHQAVQKKRADGQISIKKAIYRVRTVGC